MGIMSVWQHALVRSERLWTSWSNGDSAKESQGENDSGSARSNPTTFRDSESQRRFHRPEGGRVDGCCEQWPGRCGSWSQTPGSDKSRQGRDIYV